MSKARATVASAKRRLNKWSAERILVPSVPFARRSVTPWIMGPHGSTTSVPAMRAGYVGRR